jgi:hypothetical protein
LPWLARCLPRPFRERVVEPAYADLLLEEQNGVRTADRLAARGVFLVECLRLGLPAWLWWRGRPTRLFRGVAAAVVLVVIAIWIVATRISYGG